MKMLQINKCINEEWCGTICELANEVGIELDRTTSRSQDSIIGTGIRLPAGRFRVWNMAGVSVMRLKMLEMYLNFSHMPSWHRQGKPSQFNLFCFK